MVEIVDFKDIEEKLLEIGRQISIIKTLSKVVEVHVSEPDYVTLADAMTLSRLLSKRIYELSTYFSSLEEELHI